MWGSYPLSLEISFEILIIFLFANFPPMFMRFHYIASQPLLPASIILDAEDLFWSSSLSHQYFLC